MMIVVFVYLLALACWLGGMIFFTAIVAPVVFTVLPIADRGNFVAALFPRYYLLGYVAGTIAVVLSIFLAAARPPRLGWIVSAAAIVAALGLTVYASAVIRPQVDSLRAVVEEPNPDPARRAEFDRLHHLSVILNGGVMVLNLTALLTTAAALTPKG